MRSIDLNCDMGESDDPLMIDAEREIIRFITSANIACGVHAGDEATMRRTVRLALEHEVAIGAHPGLVDREGYGRREIGISPDEAGRIVTGQIEALRAIAESEGARITHVKPHGALYTMAARMRDLADAIADAVFRTDPSLILFGLSGSELLRSGEKYGLHVAAEVFADRMYRKDGSLVPRGEPGAVIEDAMRAVAQSVRLAREGIVIAEDGTEIELRADTLCIHGDTPGAEGVVRLIREELERRGIAVAAVGDLRS